MKEGELKDIVENIGNMDTVFLIYGQVSINKMERKTKYEKKIVEK